MAEYGYVDIPIACFFICNRWLWHKQKKNRFKKWSARVERSIVCVFKKLLKFKVKLFPGIFFQKDLMVFRGGGGGGDLSLIIKKKYILALKARKNNMALILSFFYHSWFEKVILYSVKKKLLLCPEYQRVHVFEYNHYKRQYVQIFCLYLSKHFLLSVPIVLF